MHTFRPRLILVPTDFSEPAGCALRYAAGLAELTGARLLVIYADEFIPPLNESASAGGISSVNIEELVAVAHELLIAHVETNVSSRVPFVARVTIGSPVAGIVRQSTEWNPDLLIMGTHGRTGLRRLIVGSVCEGVMRTASTPVIAVRPTAAGRSASAIQRVLCPVAYTPECADALRIAAALAPEARLVLVKLDEGDDAPHTSDNLMRLRRWLPPELVHRCELKLVAEWTAESLANFAATTGVDLIAAGATRGHGIGDLLRGTITERIVQHSECPVLAVSAQAVRTMPAEKGEGVLVGASHGCCAE